MTPSPGSPNLLLFPTELERKRFQDQGGVEPGRALQAICGFGPVAAAARTAELLGRLRPRHVFLVGIAGSYDETRSEIGSALTFSSVAIDGIGAGRGESFHGPTALGFPQLPGSIAADVEEIMDSLALSHPPGADPALLLTTCSASDSRSHADERLSRFPKAVAEDMEGFGVALACALHTVPVTVVRGISNRVGDRDPKNWRIPAALAAARRLLLEHFDDADTRAHA